MSLYATNRRLHYWVSAFLFLPLSVIIGSGLLLQVKKQVPWVQPAEQRGAGTSPTITLEAVLAAVGTTRSGAGAGWDAVNRVDLRPAKGIAKVWLTNGWEVQVDLASGAVLHEAYRRSDLIESLHDGSFFAGDWSKLGLFLPAGVALALMWGTGLWMFARPILQRRRRSSN